MAEKITRMPKKQNKRKPSKHKGSMKLILVLLILVCGFIGFQTWRVGQQIHSYEETRDSLTVQIEQAKEEQKEIEEEAEYRNSVEYIMDLAREKLGLIFENEIIFKKK